MTVASAALLCALILCVGCSTYRVEYRDRPSFHQSATDQDLPDRVVEADGTVIVYRDRAQRNSGSGNGGGTFLIREDLEGGGVVLRGFIPEHVLANLLTCMQNHEYELIWEQLLAEPTRQAYANEGQGLEEFEAFFRKRRQDLGATVNRMIHGLPRNEVVTDNLGAGTTQLRFHPTVSKQFTFKKVLFVNELTGLKLLRIE